MTPELDDIIEHAPESETATHEVGKVEFVVTCVYKKNKGDTDKEICDLLLDLMRKDSEKVVK